MAADVESPPLVDTRRLEGTLVSPRAPRPVPNHLADTSKSMNRLLIMKVCVVRERLSCLLYIIHSEVQSGMPIGVFVVS